MSFLVLLLNTFITIKSNVLDAKQVKNVANLIYNVRGHENCHDFELELTVEILGNNFDIRCHKEIFVLVL